MTGEEVVHGTRDATLPCSEKRKIKLIYVRNRLPSLRRIKVHQFQIAPVQDLQELILGGLNSMYKYLLKMMTERGRLCMMLVK